MAAKTKVTHYKVWIHIEGLDKHGDCVEGDDYHEPREVCCTKTLAAAEIVRNAILEDA